MEVEVCEFCGRSQDIGAKERLCFGEFTFERIKKRILVWENRLCFKCTKTVTENCEREGP